MNEGARLDGGTNEERSATGGAPAKFWANQVRYRRLVGLFFCLMLARTGGSPAIDSPRPGARSSYYGNGVWLDGEEAQYSNEKGHEAANDANCLAHGTVLDINPDWMLPASSDARRNHQALRNEQAAPQKHITLPELEPMRLERPAGYYFTSPLHSPITVRLSLAYGTSARLPCPVRQLSNRTVSWMKHSSDNVQLLTVGNTTYANDNRLAVAWRYPGNWTLHIGAVDLSDTGCYQCQVNTHPPIGLFVYLHVQGPAVTIVDDRNISVHEAVFKSGALIRLVCLVRQAEKDHYSLLWKFGPSVLNHDTQRGGVSVKTERRGRDAISWLLMARATSRDSGVYTCSVDGYSQATVSVHVIQGEQQAAVQELTSGARSWHKAYRPPWLLFYAIAIISSISA